MHNQIFASMFASILNLVFVSLFISSTAHSNNVESAARTIRGKIKAAPECMKSDNSYVAVFLSSGKELLQQVEVPTEGTFEFTATYAAHTVTAGSEKGCLTRVEIAAFDTKTDPPSKSIELNLTKSKRDPSSLYLGSETVSNNSSCMCFRAPCNCPTVQAFPSYISPPFAWPSMYAPMWGGFYMPGPMIGGWLNPGYYPGRGHIGFAKPNVYLEKTGSIASRAKPIQIKVKVRLLTDEATWLATSPAHGSDGWNISLSHLDGKNAQIVSDEAKYRFLYYDFRADENSLQFTSGFCGERQTLLERMKSTLKDLGFQKNEIADFDDHWKIKLPNSDACVFPQGPRELGSIAKFELQPGPAKITRVVFVVVPKSAIGAKSLDFVQAEPKKKWPRTEAVEKLTTTSAAASSPNGNYNLREWGVAFFFAPQKVAANDIDASK